MAGPSHQHAHPQRPPTKRPDLDTPEAIRRRADRADANFRARLEAAARGRQVTDEPKAKLQRELSANLAERTNQARYRTVLAASEGSSSAIEILRDSTWFIGSVTARSSDAVVVTEAKQHVALYRSMAGEPAPAVAAPPMPPKASTTKADWAKAFRAVRRARKAR